MVPSKAFVLQACQRISSFEKKPARGGTPERASDEKRKVQKVQGIFALSPPIFRMSCSPPIPWITEPEPRKRQALKNAWVKRWKTPAAKAPTPTAMNMKPSCDTVE